MTFEKLLCGICSKSAPTQGKLNRHMKTHSKPFRCETCQTGFALRADLNRHVKARHRVGNERHHCHVGYCSFKTNRKDNLKKHHRRHHGITPSSAGNGKPDNTKDELDSNSTLMQAAALGDVDKIAFFLDLGSPLEAKASDGSTMLHCAARAGQAIAVGYLLERGADTNTLNDRRRPPVYEAIMSGDVETFELLFRSVTQDHLTESELDFEHYLAQSGNLKIVQMYVDRLEKAAASPTMTRIFSQAARLGQHATVAALCTSPDIDVNQRVRINAPIHTAARYGHAKIMEVLLALSQINVRVTTNHRQMHALHIAAINGHSEVVNQLMLHRDADPNCRNTTQQTPLHLAAASGRLAAIQSLLRAQNLELHCLDMKGKTPIHYAAFGGHWKVIDLLLRHSNPINGTDTTESSPTNELFVKAEVLRQLLEYLDFETPNAKVLEYSKETLLHKAAKNGGCDMMRALLAHKDTDVNVQSRFGMSPLMVAAQFGQVEAVTLLLQHKDIDVNVQSRSGMSPLMRAAQFGQVEAVTLLLQHKDIDINQRESPSSNWTALKWAKFRKRDGIVDLLVSHGAIDYELNAPSTAPIASHIDNPQSGALQSDHDSQSDSSDGHMDDIPTEAWEEFLDMDEETAE